MLVKDTASMFHVSVVWTKEVKLVGEKYVIVGPRFAHMQSLYKCDDIDFKRFHCCVVGGLMTVDREWDVVDTLIGKGVAFHLNIQLPTKEPDTNQQWAFHLLEHCLPGRY